MARPYSPKRLPIEAIHECPEIVAWLENAFDPKDRGTAAGMLLSLKFVSHDDYAGWLRSQISAINPADKVAFYSVRKIENNTSYWDEDGNPIHRPGGSQGSEDFIYSIISSIVKVDKSTRFDHPSLDLLKKNKIKTMILIDDAIGSGDRISGFIGAMMKSIKMRSWWSYGIINFKILTYAQSLAGEKKILINLNGSNHHTRKYPKSQKISFSSFYVYDTKPMQNRWGDHFDAAFDLCKKLIQIPKRFRLGYGEVMSNLVFFHSVPNNIPGLFWCQNTNWTAIFPGRSLPEWMIKYLKNEDNRKQNDTNPFQLLQSGDVYAIMKLIKSGVRTTSGLAFRLNFDRTYTKSILQRCIKLGLVSESHRLTPRGEAAFRASEKSVVIDAWDRSMYIPESWCTNQDPFSR